MLIILLIVAAYGVIVQALMYHNQNLDITLVENMFFAAYMVIAGNNDIAGKMLDSNNHSILYISSII